MRNIEEYTEDYIHYIFGEDKDLEYSPIITQVGDAFRAGFNLSKELHERQKALEELTQNNSWIVVGEDLPHNDRDVLIKVKDYRRPEDNIFEVSMGYYDNGEWRYMSDMLVNSGHGWMIHSWREIPN